MAPTFVPAQYARFTTGKSDSATLEIMYFINTMQNIKKTKVNYCCKSEDTHLL